MISKAVRGKGFSGAISYICEKSNHIEMRNLIGDDWMKAAAQMRLLHNANPKSSKPVYHQILSFSPDENLSNEQLCVIADRMLEKLNLSDHQSVYAIHLDTDHHHIHVVTNLISLDGKYKHLDHDFRVRPIRCREIEQEFDLKKFEYTSEKNKILFPQERISEVQKILNSSKSFDEFSKALNERGLKISEKSSKRNALNYRITDVKSGAYIAGSKVHSNLTSPTSIKKIFTEKKSDKKISTNHSNEIGESDLSSLIKDVINISKDWNDAAERLSNHRIKLEIVRSGERVRGIRFTDSNGTIHKASDLGISYKNENDRFESLPKKKYDKTYDEHMFEKDLKKKIWEEFKTLPKKKPDEKKLKELKDLRSFQISLTRREAWKKKHDEQRAIEKMDF